MQASRRSSISSDRTKSLDGLRGFAAAIVVLYHSIIGPNERVVPEILYRSLQDQHTTYTVALKVALALLNGELAVATFFVISGIVLFRTARHLLTRDGGLHMGWTFALRRFLRIWPVLAVYLTAHWTLFAIIGQRWPGVLATFTWQDLTDNLLLVRFQVNGATWTLLWELIATPIIVLTVMVGARFGRLAVPVSAFLLLLALSKFLPHGIYSPDMLGSMPFLATGMIIECGWFHPLTVSAWRSVVTAVAALILFISMLLIAPASHWLWHYLFILLTLPLLVAMAATTRGGFLLARPSQLLGRLSFSLYLWNVPVFEMLFAMLDPAEVHAHPLEYGLLGGLASILLSLPLALLSERTLERPAIAIGRVLTRSRHFAKNVQSVSAR